MSQNQIKEKRQKCPFNKRELPPCDICLLEKARQDFKENRISSRKRITGLLKSSPKKKVA